MWITKRLSSVGRGFVVLGVLLSVASAWGQRGGNPGFTSPPSVLPKPATIDVVSPNFGSRGSTLIDSIVMHTTEVSLQGTLNIFTSTSSQVSAHFVIAPNGDLYQMVDTRDRAWHATYYNSRSVGIEMVGFAGQSSTWNDDNLGTLVELMAWLVTAYPDVPLVHPLGNAYGTSNDRYDQPGVVAHGQVQPWNRTDPGVFFPWDAVLSDVGQRVRVIPEPAAVMAGGALLGLCLRRRDGGEFVGRGA